MTDPETGEKVARLYARWQQGESLRDLAKEVGVTRERMRQLLTRYGSRPEGGTDG